MATLKLESAFWGWNSKVVKRSFPRPLLGYVGYRTEGERTKGPRGVDWARGLAAVIRLSKSVRARLPGSRDYRRARSGSQGLWRFPDLVIWRLEMTGDGQGTEAGSGRRPNKDSRPLFSGRQNGRRGVFVPDFGHAVSEKVECPRIRIPKHGSAIALIEPICCTRENPITADLGRKVGRIPNREPKRMPPARFPQEIASRSFGKSSDMNVHMLSWETVSISSVSSPTCL